MFLAVVVVWLASTALRDTFSNYMDPVATDELIGFEGEYELRDDETPVRIEIKFRHDFANDQEAQQNVENDHMLFAQELAQLQDQIGTQSIDVQYEFRDRQSGSFNGVNAVVPSNLVRIILDFESVRAIHHGGCIDCWGKADSIHRVTFVLAGGNIDGETANVYRTVIQSGTTIRQSNTTLPVPEREGYTFVGWTIVRGDIEVIFTENTIVGDETVTARWSGVSVVVPDDDSTDEMPRTEPPRDLPPGEVPPGNEPPGDEQPEPTTSPATEPTPPATEPTPPTRPGVEPTTPTSPGVEPTTPTSPGVEPTTPTSPGVEPTTPTSPGVEPTTPTRPGVEPTTPTSPEVEPTTPTNENELPTSPEVEPTTPTDGNGPGDDPNDEGLYGFDGDYALRDDETPVQILLTFRNPSIFALQLLYDIPEEEAILIVDADHELFMDEMYALFGEGGMGYGAPVEVHAMYQRLHNGATITVPSNLVRTILGFESVIRIDRNAPPEPPVLPDLPESIEITMDSDPASGTAEYPTVVLPESVILYSVTIANTGEVPVHDVVAQIHLSWYLEIAEMMGYFNEDEAMNLDDLGIGYYHVENEWTYGNENGVRNSVYLIVDYLDPGESFTIMLATIVASYAPEGTPLISEAQLNEPTLVDPALSTLRHPWVTTYHVVGAPDEEPAPQCVVVAQGQFAGTQGLEGAPWVICEGGLLVVDSGFINTSALALFSPWNAHRAIINEIVFTGPIIAGNSLRSLFNNLTNVTSIEGLNNFNTAHVTNMSMMFNNLGRVNSLDLSSFDTRRASMLNMFAGMNSLQQLTLGRDFAFRGVSNFPNIRPSNQWTGSWQNVGPGTTDNPQGNFVFSSSMLRFMYNGQVMADTFVWQPRR